MKIYIDSAKEAEVSLAKSWGWISGVTTNPTLMAQAGQKVEASLLRLAGLGFNELFYQLTSSDLESMLKEAKTARKIVGESLVIKLPPNDLGFRFTAKYSDQFPCCLTAIYSPGQALVARAAGANYVAVYVNRATRLLGDGIGLVNEVSNILKGSYTEIIAASIKSPQEATSAFLAGAAHLTLSFEMLNSLHQNALSDETIKEFKQNGLGLVDY